MEASTSNDPDVKTFRGRSLEEILPQIREELGPEAIVLRRREGLTGGVGGFFQRPYVEVDARGPMGEERPLEIRSDRATAEGLSSPAVQALFEQATPFADALAAAARESRMEEDTFAATFGEPEEEPVRMRDAAPEPPAGLYGPQPNAGAIRDVAEPEPEVEDPEEPAVFDEPAAFEVPPAPDPSAPSSPTASRPASADAAQDRLVSSGLSPALAADVVGEAVVHSLPFSAPRNMKRLRRPAPPRRPPPPPRP